MPERPGQGMCVQSLTSLQIFLDLLMYPGNFVLTFSELISKGRYYFKSTAESI